MYQVLDYQSGLPGMTSSRKRTHKGNPNENQPNLRPCNQRVPLVNTALLRSRQAQAADPGLVQILTQMLKLMQRPHLIGNPHQLISILCYHKNILMVLTLVQLEVIGQLLKNMLLFK